MDDTHDRSSHLLDSLDLVWLDPYLFSEGYMPEVPLLTNAEGLLMVLQGQLRAQPKINGLC